MYLVDTNVLTAGAPQKAVSHPQLAAWMDRHSHLLFLSVVTIAEVEFGIEKLRRHNAVDRVQRLAGWLETVLHLYAARVLPLDISASRVLGRLSDQARAQGHAPEFADLAIAATAQHRGCTVLTRNLRHFAPIGVAALDPFEGLPVPGFFQSGSGRTA